MVTGTEGKKIPSNLLQFPGQMRILYFKNNIFDIFAGPPRQHVPDPPPDDLDAARSDGHGGGAQQDHHGGHGQGDRPQ